MPQSPAEELDITRLTETDIAVRLLELRQRMAAFDSLYDEEITCLTRELSQLEADFIRHYQTPGARPGTKSVVPGTSKQSSRTKRSPRGSHGDAGSSIQGMPAQEV
jgi:hypothetical protein